VSISGIPSLTPCHVTCVQCTCCIHTANWSHATCHVRASDVCSRWFLVSRRSSDASLPAEITKSHSTSPIRPPPPPLNGRNAIRQSCPMTHTTLRSCSTSRIFIDAIKRPRLNGARTLITGASSDVSWHDLFISSSALPPFPPSCICNFPAERALCFADNRF